MQKVPIVIAEDSPFLTTETRQVRWAVPYNFACLNARIDNLLTRNVDCIKGKRILDIGSHMGTFAYAALEMGAEFVQGIDTEAKTIERGQKLFQQLKVPESRYSLKVDDAFRYLENLEEGSFDTVLCLGTLYYMVEPYRLLKLMQKVAKEDRKSTRLNSSHVVISYAVFCLKKKNKNTVSRYSLQSLTTVTPHS